MNNQISPQLIEHKKTKTNGIRNSGPGLGQAQKRGEAKPPHIASWTVQY